MPVWDPRYVLPLRSHASHVNLNAIQENNRLKLEWLLALVSGSITKILAYICLE